MWHFLITVIKHKKNGKQGQVRVDEQLLSGLCNSRNFLHRKEFTECSLTAPSGQKKQDKYELFKFLALEEGSAFSRRCLCAINSESRMTEQQQKTTRYLDRACRCKWAAAFFLFESAPRWFYCTGMINTVNKHCEKRLCVCVPGCLRWWSMGSQTWHWLAASPPCLQPLHSADRSGLASNTPFRPVHKKATTQTL